MGGRMASLIADRACLDRACRDGACRDGADLLGLACLGYPFHPTGRPERLRTAHLAALRTPCLICQGTRDPLGNAEEVAGYALAPGIRLHWSADGDHTLNTRKRGGSTRKRRAVKAGVTTCLSWWHAHI